MYKFVWAFAAFLADESTLQWSDSVGGIMGFATPSHLPEEVPQDLLHALRRLAPIPTAPSNVIRLDLADGASGSYRATRRADGESHQSAGRRALGPAQLRFEALARHANVAIVILAGTRPIFANAEAAVLFGYPSAEGIIALKSIGGLVTRHHRAGLRSLNRQLLTGTTEVASYEIDGRTWDGRAISVKGHAFLIPWEEGTAVCHTLVDITGRREAEALAAQRLAELAHFDRITTLDRMAATVAHEIAQPLLALSMAAGASRRLLSQQTPDIATALGAIDIVVAQAERMRNLMVGIRRFSAGGPISKPRCEPVDAVDAAAEALKLLQPLMERSNVRCSLSAEVPPEDRTVHLHPVQLSQVVVNLLSNAAEAIRTSGEAEGEILIRVTRRDEEVVIEVEDDGPGISPEDAERVFEPYFSSKDSGMGLGLAVCRSIIQEAGGNIEAENRSAGGAVFRARLPAHAASPAG